MTEHDELSAKEVWYLTDHLMRKERRERRLNKERKARKRYIKQEHKRWLMKPALDKVRESSIAEYKRVQYAWW